jgi:hypothetical protein
MGIAEEQELARARRAEAERLRQGEEGRFEAARRERARVALSTERRRLHDELAPPSPALESDENDATVRILPDDTVASALRRETSRARSQLGAYLAPDAPTGPELADLVTPRILGAYDPETAVEIGRLEGHFIEAERVYAHLVSFGWKGVPPILLGSIARRLTVLLINKHWLLPYRARNGRELEVAPEPAPAVRPPVAEPELCLECGADLSTPGPRCDACGGIDAAEAVRAPAPEPPPKPAPPPRSRSKAEMDRERRREAQAKKSAYANREMVLDFTGGPRPLPPGMGIDVPSSPEREERAAVDYARLVETVRFAGEREVDAHGAVKAMHFTELVSGTVVEVLAPSEYDRKYLEKQLVTIRWGGRARLVEASSLEGATERDFDAQEKA